MRLTALPEIIFKAARKFKMTYVKFYVELLIVGVVIYSGVYLLAPDRALFAAVSSLVTIVCANFIHKARGISMLANCLNWRIIVPLAVFLCIFGFTEGLVQGLVSIPTILGLVILLDSINSLIARKIKK